MPLMVLHYGTILVFGGWKNNRKCLQLDGGTWKDHSTLNEARYWHSTVTTQRATFIFGGAYSATTYEYLPQDSTTWIKGKKDIPGGFRLGAAIAINSEQEIWLIGGFKTGKRILSFNVNDHTFQELPSLLSVKRIGHKCAFIPNTNKVMITGGYNSSEVSTEILDTVDGSISMASPMTSKRCSHGIGTITFEGEDKLMVLGGFDGRKMLDSIEVYHAKMQKWVITDLKLNEPKVDFDFLTVKHGDIISNLN